MQLQEKRKLSVRQRLVPKMTYQAQNTNNTDDEYEKYLDGTKTSFKERYGNHLRDVKYKKYMKRPKLSKCIWSLKNQCVIPIVKWRIVKKVSPIYCKLNLIEKFFIIKSLDDSNLLNKRSELVTECRHQSKLLLCNVKRNDSVD